MAFLTPDKIVTAAYKGGTIKIKQKITPDTARKPDGTKPKPCAKLNGGTGVPKGITVHNTGDISVASGTTPAEQYARATWPNANMKDVAVHFWVYRDDVWQQLSENERGWHAGDGSTRRASQRKGETIGGNLDTVSIECIGGDAASEDTTAKLVAYLLMKHGLNPDTDIYTHNYFMGLPNKIVNGAKKNCPVYILPHWDTFMATVKKYYGAPDVAPEPEQPSSGTPAAAFNVGDVVTFTGKTHYTSANASSGNACKGGKAKITQFYKGGKHPYHLIREPDGGSTVYGWVDAADIAGAPAQAEIKAGSTVRLKQGAKTYTGGNLAAFVYARDHVVKEISGDRVVITYGGTVVAAVKKSDLSLA
ncbi:N-acetylmuramoyl-L-alanine amidase [Dehalobacter sp. UNSWDHB]|uniref:peptidoglycan recognition protein family protein n=1 Tax=Dehalobacter sp. UNSWDHB TaxID=1339256 RepID=UPI0003876EAD|nr:N-acetylmuramoyl-L-alanine amidase [Dehalobacter sp. UNSWDHB]EQB20048.1 N-acetylmuramoyl-L-alanine amidase [Dehalobacter sp. UNSWDHB]